MPDYLTKRNGFWQFVHRVPLEFAELDPRGVIKHSTNVAIAKDRRGVRAGKIAEKMKRDLEAYWLGLSEGKAKEATERYTKARRQARTGAVEHHEPEELANRAIVERLERLEALMAEVLKLMKERLKK